MQSWGKKRLCSTLYCVLLKSINYIRLYDALTFSIVQWGGGGGNILSISFFPNILGVTHVNAYFTKVQKIHNIIMRVWREKLFDEFEKQQVPHTKFKGRKLGRSKGYAPYPIY